MSIRQAGSRESRKGLVAAARHLRQGQTRSEELLWSALRDRRFCGLKFRRQSRIGHFVVDFYCASERLVIEVDGAVHEAQRDHDRERQRMIEEMGRCVKRVRAWEVERDIAGVLDAIGCSLNPGPSPSTPREKGGPPRAGRDEGGTG